MTTRLINVRTLPRMSKQHVYLDLRLRYNTFWAEGGIKLIFYLISNVEAR